MARRARSATPGAGLAGGPGGFLGPRTKTAGERAFKKMGLGKVGGATSGFGSMRGGAGGAFKASRMKKGVGGKGGGY